MDTPRWPLIGAVLILSGCTAIQKAEQATRAKSEMIGMSRDQVLDCAGVPARTARAGDSEYLAYSTNPETNVWSNNQGNIFSDTRDCTVTVKLTGGYVSEVTYRGNKTGGLLTKDSHCATVVGSCIAHRE